MITRIPGTLALAAALLLAAVSAMSAFPASAADIQVTYSVNAKVLKKSTPAGTPLSFQLYTDSTCATSAGAPQVANVEAVTLIEQPKLIKVKGGPTPPMIAEIRYTLTGITPQPAFYAKVNGTGITPIGTACQLQTASVGGTLPLPPLSCPPDSVLAGSSCVDQYEASLWDIPPGATTVIQHVKDGTATLAELTGAGATELSLASNGSCLPAIPGTFPPNGNYTVPLYAVSVPGVIPTACVTAYQANAACQLSTKHLPTNSEWTAAGNGTTPGFNDNGTTDCNTSTAATPLNTGSRSACVSTTGAFDMVGNVQEWALEPGTWLRGGAWANGPFFPSILDAVSITTISSGSTFGFRCAR